MRVKYRAEGGANSRRRRNKKARYFTDFLTQKSTQLSTDLEESSWTMRLIA